jgi:hypothetical protein
LSFIFKGCLFYRSKSNNINEFLNIPTAGEDVLGFPENSINFNNELDKYIGYFLNGKKEGRITSIKESRKHFSFYQLRWSYICWRLEEQSI